MWIEREIHDLHPQYRKKENHSWNHSVKYVRNKEKEREIGQQERKTLSGHWTWGKISGEKEMGREPVKVSWRADQQERRGRKTTWCRDQSKDSIKVEIFSSYSPVFLCLSPRETKTSALPNVRNWMEERFELVPGPEGCWVGCVLALEQDRSTQPTFMMNRGFSKREGAALRSITASET